MMPAAAVESAWSPKSVLMSPKAGSRMSTARATIDMTAARSAISSFDPITRVPSPMMTPDDFGSVTRSIPALGLGAWERAS